MHIVPIANLEDIGKLNMTCLPLYFTPMESVCHRTVMETSVASSDKTVDGISHFLHVGSGLIWIFDSNSLLLSALFCLPCAKIYTHSCQNAKFKVFFFYLFFYNNQVDCTYNLREWNSYDQKAQKKVSPMNVLEIMEPPVKMCMCACKLKKMWIMSNPTMFLKHEQIWEDFNIA